MQCPRLIFESDIELKCSILSNYGFSEVAGSGNPNYPCNICKSQWKDGPPTADNLTPMLVYIIQSSPPLLTLNPSEHTKETQEDKTQDNKIEQAQFPSTIQQAISYGQSIYQFAKSGFQQISDEAYNERLNICLSCEHYEDNRCKLCGCRLNGENGFTSKLRQPHQTCPANPPKWGPIL